MPVENKPEKPNHKPEVEEPKRDEKEIVREKLQKRYQDLNRRLETEINVGIRYDLKVRVDELAVIFELLTK